MADEIWKTQQYAEHYNTLYCQNPKAVTACLGHLSLTSEDVFIDLGCGKGDILGEAARIVKHAIGLDISAPQIELAREATRGFDNVSFIESPFLEAQLERTDITKAVGRKSLHHLTDPEKAQFFKLLGSHFRPGGLFIIEDGIFDFKKEEIAAKWPGIIPEAEAYYGENWEAIREDFRACLFEEYTTGADAWMHALVQGGFEIVNHWQVTSFYGGILARKGA